MLFICVLITLLSTIQASSTPTLTWRCRSGCRPPSIRHCTLFMSTYKENKIIMYSVFSKIVSHVNEIKNSSPIFLICTSLLTYTTVLNTVQYYIKTCRKHTSEKIFYTKIHTKFEWSQFYFFLKLNKFLWFTLALLQ